MTPRTPSGISLFHHLIFPDDYGWPTDDQLAEAIRAIEDEMPPDSDLRMNRDGVYASFGCFTFSALLIVAFAIWIAWPK